MGSGRFRVVLPNEWRTVVAERLFLNNACRRNENDYSRCGTKTLYLYVKSVYRVPRKTKYMVYGLRVYQTGDAAFAPDGLDSTVKVRIHLYAYVCMYIGCKDSKKRYYCRCRYIFCAREIRSGNGRPAACV